MEEKTAQTLGAPLETIAELQDFVASEPNIDKWDHCSIIVDKENIVILLRNTDKRVIQALRISLETEEEILEALTILKKEPRSKLIPCSVIEDGIGKISDFNHLNIINDNAKYDDKTTKNAYQFFEIKNEEDKKKRGRDISKPVAQQVVFDAHGYCMYEGCGEYLLNDRLTGIDGNYHYLAHIVASSPNGPRGNELSHQLSDVPQNIMLLCDKHHRLIDKVAVGEHSKETLDQMRSSHIDKVEGLLEGLGYSGAPVVDAIWAIGGWSPNKPNSVELAKSLAPFKARHNGNRFELANHNGIAGHEWEQRVISDLNAIKQHYLLTQNLINTAQAIYAIGPSSILVALGSIIGNKNQVHAVPRSREKDAWCWVREEPLSNPFRIEGYDEINSNSKEVVIAISLTDSPAEFSNIIATLGDEGTPAVHVFARQPGNDCLGHPVEGAYLRELVHQLLHRLGNEKNVKKVHILLCAPNAASIEIGRAIEHFHPSIRVYDYAMDNERKNIVPIFELVPSGKDIKIEPIVD